MEKPEPSITANWIDAIIAARVDPRDIPEDTHDLIKQVFDFGASCGRCEFESREHLMAEILSDNHNRRIARLERVLAKVIAWNVREYGQDGARRLLEELADDSDAVELPD